jgi:hypothetical protein
MTATIQHYHKAKDMPVETRVHWRNDIHLYGKVIYNNLIQGDEVVAIEWIDGSVRTVNVNDLVRDEKVSR